MSYYNGLLAAASANRRFVQELFTEFRESKSKVPRRDALVAKAPAISDIIQEHHQRLIDLEKYMKWLDGADYPGAKNTQRAFDLLKAFLAKNPRPASLQFLVVHYRGMLSREPKKTFFYPPDGKGKAANEAFLKVYERMQNGSRHTLNSLLAAKVSRFDSRRAQEANAADAPCAMLIVCRAVEGDMFQFRPSIPAGTPELLRWDLLLGRTFIRDILFAGESGSVVDQIEHIVGSHKGDPDDASTDVSALRKDLAWCRAGLIRRLLKLAGRHWQCEHEAASLIKSHAMINELAAHLAQEKFAIADAEQRIDITVQILQGVGIMLQKCGGEFFGLISSLVPSARREISVGLSKPAAASSEIFGLLTPPESRREKAHLAEWLKTCVGGIDLAERALFRELLLDLEDKGRSREKPYSDALACVLQDDAARERVKSLLKWGDPGRFNFGVLAAVIRMAQVLRPAAVHETKELNITFIVGYRSLIGDILRLLSKLHSPPKSADIEWELGDSNIASSNSKLLEGRARILGNAEMLQRPGRALFVDAAVDTKHAICSHLVEVSAPHWLGVLPEDAHGFTKYVPELFLVRVRGRKRIEIWQGGEKRLVWSDDAATWGSEQTWSEIALRDQLNRFISTCGKALEKDTTACEAARVLASTVIRISQSHGKGASFVAFCGSRLRKKGDRPDQLPSSVANCAAQMTHPFPNKGEGCLTDAGIHGLMEVAVQDGGTLVDLEADLFLGRRQWLPVCALGRPFDANRALVPKEFWSESAVAPSRPEPSENSEVLVLPPIRSYPSKSPLIREAWRNRYVRLPGHKGGVRDNILFWERWYNTLTWGTRHMASLGISCTLWDRALVITVSTDGYVTVFCRGCEVTLKPSQALVQPNREVIP